MSPFLYVIHSNFLCFSSKSLVTLDVKSKYEYIISARYGFWGEGVSTNIQMGHRKTEVKKI